MKGWEMIPTKTMTVLLCLMLASAPAWAAPPSVRGGEGPIAWLDCTFGPLPDRESARLHIMTLGDRVQRAVVQPYGLAGTDGSALKLANGRLVGRLVIGHDELRMNRSLVPRTATRMPVELDVVLAAGKVTGTFSGSWPTPKTRDTPMTVQGTVTGTVRNETQLRQDFGLSDEAAWTSWLGPNQNFSAEPGGGPLVEDLRDARLLWVSQWIGPTESGSQRYGACVGCPPAAGGASPLVWKGRVYQFRHEATGHAVQQVHLDKVLGGELGSRTRAKMQAIGWTEADLKRRWAIRANEQLVSIDAATGQTVWTIDWPGEGINLYDHKCSLTNHTGVIAGGKVYVFGAMGFVRCVDPQTGKAVWATRVPGYADFMDALLSRCVETQNVHAPTRSFCHGLNASGSVVVAPDGIGTCGLVALDTETGRIVWRVEGRVLGKCATPMAWRKDGRDYVLAASDDGKITCIQAASGQVAWQYEEAGHNEYQPLLVGDLLIAHKLTREEREKAPRSPDDGPHSAPGQNYGQVACWRLTPEGPEEMWQAPADWGAPANCPIGSVAGGLICFRGNYSYYLVDPETGRRVASTHLPVHVRWDEGHLLALPDLFVLHPDSQHGHTKMFLLPAREDGVVSPLWSPPHPWATTYQSAMSHAWADGRLFIRGADAIYCYDLRDSG
jgi:outer membrane protein assembly factor BamB